MNKSPGLQIGIIGLFLRFSKEKIIIQLNNYIYKVVVNLEDN